jgi:hypothetical protein
MLLLRKLGIPLPSGLYGSLVKATSRQCNLEEMGCEHGRWMELAHDRVQSRVVVLAVLNLRVLLPES